MSNPNEKILVVLSGGQDSTICLYLAKKYAKEVVAVTFDYGQSHSIEIESATTIAGLANVPHEIIKIPNCLHSTSPLITKRNLEQYENFDQMTNVIGNRVEKTFVPLRNMLFLTIAANRAVELGCTGIMTGICEADGANYPDCTENFREAFEVALNHSLGITNDSEWLCVYAPLINLSKAESIKRAKGLDGCMIALAYSHTCYNGQYPPVNMNHANILRAKGFELENTPDPLVLRAWLEGVMELPETQNYDEVRSELRGDRKHKWSLKDMIEMFCLKKGEVLCEK